MSDFIDTFKSLPPVQRRLFLAEMACNYTDAEYRELHAVLSELHERLSFIEGD